MIGRFRAGEGTSARLIQLCLAYFLFYVVTGVSVKYFLGSSAKGFPGLDGIQFLVYSTVGGTGICLAVVLARGWYRLHSNGSTRLGPLTIPSEYLYIIPSGVCTAVVIPTTTLMYTLPISVMVAMVIMRGSVIVLGRLVDAVQIRQGLLKKRVYWEEEVAVLLALGAVAMGLLAQHNGKGDDFDFVRSPAALAILGSYIVAYAFRIYIMNYYKNSRGRGVPLHNEGFFGVEQVAAAVVMALVAVLVVNGPRFGWDGPQVQLFRGAFASPRPAWPWAVVAGTAYGMVAFFSVFIFMFKGRTATFAGLVNRLTSLLAGTASTLLFFVFWGGKPPERGDWASLAFILAAVVMLTLAERKRAAELARE